MQGYVARTGDHYNAVIYEGTDPITGRERRRWHPAGADRVVSGVTYRGTHRGSWAGLPASGRSFEVAGIDIFSIAAGQVTALWHSTDHYEIAIQLGAVMTPG